MPRRFPPPWTVAGNDSCYWIEDAEGKRLAFIYFHPREVCIGSDSYKRLERDEARRIARGIARLPELLGS